MSSKQIGFLGVGLALLVLCAFERMALNPSGPSALVDLLSMGILLAALAAFVSEELWAPAIVVLTTILVFAISLLIRPPMPSFIIAMFTVLAFMGTLLYFSVSAEQLDVLGRSFKGLVDSPKLKLHRVILLALIPAWAAAVTWEKTGSELAAPVFPRSVHPAPPDQSDFNGKGYGLASLENPYRRLEKEDPQKFKDAVAEGKKIYYQNCFLCHGDHLDGKGPYADALNPLPANFQDAGTIAMLQESYVFWRVSKGGPGMPGSGHPWSSAMPQWEKTLSEDDIWKTTLWLYSYTNQSPRTWEKVEHK